MRKRYTTQNLYKTNLTNPVNWIDDIGNTDDVFTITVDETPLSTLSEWFLVIDFNIPDKRDFIKYHDVTWNVFSYYRKDRDLLNNGSKSIRHNAWAYVQINVVKEFTEHLFNNVDDFGYIEDFWNDDIKVYGWYVDTPTWPTLIADARLNWLSNGTRYIFFDYADNTFKKLSSTSWYIGFQVATIVVSSGDITSITDTRTLDLPVRYDPTVFDFGADWELKLVGSPSISDATTATKGRVRLWDLTDHENATAWPVVVTTENLVKTSTGATDENKVPILDEYWYIDWSMIPTIILANATDSWTDTYVTTADPPLSEYVTWQLFTVTFAETNTTTTPTLNIDWLWAVTITDKDSVALAVWDITTNKMILMKVWSAFKIMQELTATATRQGITTKAWWTSADWALSISSWTTTLAIPANWYLEKNYTSVNITGGTLNFTWNGVVVIKCSGNFTMSAWTIDLDGIGWAWWAPWGWGGSRWLNNLLVLHTNAGWAWWAPWAWTAWALSFQVNNITNRLFSAGAWWGWWAAWNWWAWWAWWWLLIVECAWKINISWWTIRARGIAWSNWTSTNWWGWGWGWWWAIVILWTVLTITWTLQANWWNWWNGSWTSWSANWWGWWWGWLWAWWSWWSVTVAWSSWSVWFAYPSGIVTWWNGWTSWVNTMWWWGWWWGWFIYVSQY